MAQDPKLEWISHLAQTEVGLASFVTNLPPDPSLTSKFATISNVSDPLSLGRVKITLESENNSFELSNWCYVIGSPGGNLSTDFIGEKCLVTFESGDSNKAIVLGIIPSNGTTSIGNPVKYPVIKLENNSPTGKIPPCDLSNLGTAIMIEEISGTSQKVCRRDDSGAYEWMSPISPQVIRTNTVEVKSPEQNIGDPIGSYVPGDIFVRKSCQRDQFIPFIADYSSEGNPRFRPLVSAPVYNRATVPDCNSDMIGSMGMFEVDSNNTFTGICGKKEGKFKWMTLDSREVIKFKERFVSKEEAVEYITNTTQNCQKPSDLNNSNLDDVNKQTKANLSDVPTVVNPLDLTAYVNTDGFKNTLEDELSARDADKGARDRASLLRTQINQTAFKVADNNITAIERYLLAQHAISGGLFAPTFNDLLDFIDTIAGSIIKIARVLGRSSKTRRAVGAVVEAEILNLVKLPNQAGVVPRFKEFLTQSDTAVENLLLPLQPGQAGNSFTPNLSSISNVNSTASAVGIGIDLSVTTPPITSSEYKLDETIETLDPEGTQIGSVPVNPLLSSLVAGNLNIGSYIDSLGNFPDVQQEISSAVSNIFSSILPQSVSSIFNRVRELDVNNLSDVLRNVIPNNLLNTLSPYISIGEDNIVRLASFESIQQSLINTLPNTSETLELINSAVNGIDTPIDILRIISSRGVLFGLSNQEVRSLNLLIENINLNTGVLQPSPDLINSIADVIGVELPFDQEILEFIGAEPQRIAQLAAEAFFSPEVNRGNYGELVQLMTQSDVDARQYITIMVGKLSGIEIPQENLLEAVRIFRELINPEGTVEN